MSPSCLAPFGGPVEPGIVFGGHPKANGSKYIHFHVEPHITFDSAVKSPHPVDEPTDYRLARGLVITILLNNYNDRDRVQPALKWEQRYIDFLRSYSNEHLDIAFSAERSIEDGIQEISEADASTVLISYAVMFVYVALALGRLRSWRTLLVRYSILISQIRKIMH